MIPSKAKLKRLERRDGGAAAAHACSCLLARLHLVARGRSRAGAAGRARAAPRQAVADDLRADDDVAELRAAGPGSSSRPSIGNESTSVTSSLPRCSRFSARISSAPTNASPSSPRRPPRRASTADASRPPPASSISPPLRFSTSTATVIAARARARLLGVELVRLDDPLDELVADDVLRRRSARTRSVDRAEDVPHLDQAGALVARQVDLGHVAGDDDLRAEAEPRQEHLHLLGRRVLRLVEDDERVVQRAAAHERERRDLDHAPLHVGREPVGVEHVVERVEQRPQVRVDLREHVARQEAEPLAGLDRRAREDDARDLALDQRGDGERDRQVGLAGAGRADPERDRGLRGSRRRSASASRVFGAIFLPRCRQTTS